MNTRKKIGALAMTLMMLFTVTACGGEAAETADDGGSSGEQLPCCAPMQPRRIRLLR